MPPVFNRHIPAPHRYEAALTDWERKGGEDAAMADNLRWDHRVSPEREEHLENHVENRPTDGGHLRTALVKCFEDTVRHSHAPSFLDQVTNGHNIVHGGTDNLNDFNQERALVNILDLHGLGAEYAKACSAKTLGFEKYERHFDDTKRLLWLDERLNHKSPGEQAWFVEQVLTRLNLSRKESRAKPNEFRPFEPAWVSFWDDFEPFLDDGPNRWCEVLGVPKVLDRVWVVLLKYTVSNACTLVRPTQLDAGFFSYHFPSPPNLEPWEGGRAMDLGFSTLDGAEHGADIALLPEFIHPRIDLHRDYIVKVGCTSRATAPDNQGLRQRREQHWRLLAKRANSPFATWMPR